MKIPIHLNALRAVDATARHGSFPGAASELGVTPAAVGQMVRGLEDWLGKPLFHRATSGHARLTPTDLADQALPDIRLGLDHFAAALEQLQIRQNGVLTVSTSPAFAAKWLLPRIDRFQMRWPEIDIRLDTSLKLADYAAQGIDIGVRYGTGHWPGLNAELLMEEEVFPVCAPSRLARAPVTRPADLLGQTLIHDMSVAQHPDFLTWDRWMKAVGLPPAPERGLRINNSAAVLQGAIEGQGIALARSILAQDDLRAGRLVRLFPDLDVPSPLAYHLVSRPERAASQTCAAFAQWVREEASQSFSLP